MMSGVGRWAVACVAALLLTACEAEDSTPLPAFVAETVTPAPATATPGPLGYGLAHDASLTVADDTLLSAASDVTRLEAGATVEAGSVYGLVARYGDAEGWTRSPVVPRVSLLISPRRPPLDQPDIAALLLAALDASALVTAHRVSGSEPLSLAAQTPTTRTALANAGWPDGFDVALGYGGLPGAEAVAAQYAALGVNVGLVVLPPDALLPALADGRVNMALVSWAKDEDRAALVNAVGEARVIDLYTLPITFQAVDGLRLAFTPGGWPYVQR
jgi:hypothetical protein